MPDDLDDAPDSASGSRDPDRALKWLLGVIGVGVLVNALSTTIDSAGWAVLPPALFTLAAVTVVPRTGLLRREPHAGTRWARGLATAALLAYLAVAIWGTTIGWPLPVLILSTACLLGHLRAHHMANTAQPPRR